jgi:hypothetical protein
MTSTIIQPDWFKTEDYTSPKYPNSADCLNTRSTQGRNATPLDIFPAVRQVMGGIELDVASDELINEGVQADRIYTLKDDGFSRPWYAQSLFLNAPGSTVTGGTYAERLLLLDLLEEFKQRRKEKPKGVSAKEWKKELDKEFKQRRPEDVKVVTAIDWYRKLYQEWSFGNVKQAIALHYRAGSIGGLGIGILSLPLCITAAGAISPVVNGSGRFAFEIIQGDERIPETNNTQSSAFTYFPDITDMEGSINRFRHYFKQFGVVKV